MSGSYFFFWSGAGLSSSYYACFHFDDVQGRHPPSIVNFAFMHLLIIVPRLAACLRCAFLRCWYCRPKSCSIFSMLLELLILQVAGGSLIPTTLSTAPHYYTTWATQVKKNLYCVFSSTLLRTTTYVCLLMYRSSFPVCRDTCLAMVGRQRT